MVLLEGVPVPALSYVLESKQGLPLRVVLAPPQDTRVIPLARLGSHPHEGRASLAQGQNWLFHGTGLLSVNHPPRPGSIVGGDRIDLRLSGALT